MMISYVISSKNIFINCDGESKIISNSDKNYDKILELIKKDADVSEFKKILFEENNLKETCQKSFKNTDIEIGEDTILIDGEPVYGGLCKHIRNLYERDLPLDSVVNFVKKLRKNPSYRIREQLWGFIEAAQADGGFTLDNDGNIIAYKVVSRDYKDKYTGKNDNSIGCVVEMPRTQVDDDPEKTCSAGLHFCAYSYVKDFCTIDDHLMLVKVSPEDVVSIPVDYGYAKARCCKYEVIAETEKPVNEPLYDEGADEENVPDFDDDFFEEFVTEWLDSATLKEVIGLYEYMMENAAEQFDSKEEYIDAILEEGGDFETIREFIRGYTQEDSDDECEACKKCERFDVDFKPVCEKWLEHASIGELLAFADAFIENFDSSDFKERDEIINAIVNHFEVVGFDDMAYLIAEFEDKDIDDVMCEYGNIKRIDTTTCPDCMAKSEKFCIEWLNNASLKKLLEFGDEWVEGFDGNKEYSEREDIVAEIRSCYETYMDMLDEICDYDGISKKDILESED